MNSLYKIVLCCAIIVSSCTTPPKKITDTNDYNIYLELAQNKALQAAKNDNEFWKQKLETTPNQFPYLGKLATSYSNLFEITGKISYLKQAENYLVQANKATEQKDAGYLRALASNYISQHRFKEALQQLTKAELIGENLEATQKMLFDAHLELGNYKLAEGYLEMFKDFSDFDYLIRLSKWSDHKGNLDAAIKYMEKAKSIAESSNLDGIKQWSFTNLADFYGHAGKIEASYTHYLKALELNPNDAYAKKGIAWIVYSHENNPDEALRILNTVTTTFFAPDYYLLKAEIAEYKQDIALKNEQLKLYKEAVKDTSYGDMYNKYNVLLYACEKENRDEAIMIAKTEVGNRPTPQSYDLLAWAEFKNGNLNGALNIVENHIADKTFEPETLYHIAEIYKAFGKYEKVKPLKEELLGSLYELGPTMKEKIEQL